MHFIRSLVNFLLPINIIFEPAASPVPPGDDLVITSRGNFVITSRGGFVLVKA